MVMFYDNDTKVRGICGELWHLLADYLNFTYVIINNTIFYVILHRSYIIRFYSCSRINNLMIKNYYIFSFRLIPIKTHSQGFGRRLENGSYEGLVRMLVQDEAQVIMRSGFYTDRMEISDLTIPIWKSV